jgi:hypothetical protein
MRTLLATLAAFAAIAPPAGAQGTATATPNTTGTPTVLHTEFDASQPPVSGRFPERTVLSLQRGFRLDLKAVARRCPRSQAQSDAQGEGCPARSRIGSALVVAEAFGAEYRVPIELYLAKRRSRAEVAGVVVVATVNGSRQAAMGRIVRAAADPYGLAVILPAPGGGDLSGLPITFKSFSADIGGNAKGRPLSRRVKRRRHHFLRTPQTCAGMWASSAAFTFADGSTATVDTPIACS